MKSALASFGRVVIEAAMPQINIPDILPQLTLGAELSQHFRSVYNVSQIDISAIEAAQALYSSPGIKKASEMAVQANRMNAMCAMLAIESITAATNAMNFHNDEFFDGAEEINSVEDDEEQLSIDLNDSGDENP